MMKYLGVSIAVILTLLIVGAVALFSFLPQNEPQAPQVETVSVSTQESLPVAANAPRLDVNQVEDDLAQREAVYQGQMTQLDQMLQERQMTYQEQANLLGTQVATAQAQLDELTAQEQALTGQITELEAARTERLTLYQNQLAQARNQYEARYAELQSQLDEVLTNLDQTNAQLGR